MSIAILKYAIVILILIAMSWGGLKKDREWLVVKFNLFTKAFMFLILYLFLFLTYDAIIDEEGPVLLVYIILFSIDLVLLLGAIAFFRTKIWFNDDCIYYQKPFFGRIILKFDDISSIEQINPNKSMIGSEILLRGTGGEKIEVPLFMNGAQDFLEYVLRRYSKNI